MSIQMFLIFLSYALNGKIMETFVWDSSGCTTYCSWFGFKIGVKNSVILVGLVCYLQTRNIGS